VLGAFCFLFTLNLFLRGRSTEALGGILGLVIFGVIGSGFYFASWQFGLLMFGLSFVFIAVSKPPAVRWHTGFSAIAPAVFGGNKQLTHRLPPPPRRKYPL
jgi:hypothetical protein